MQYATWLGLRSSCYWSDIAYFQDVGSHLSRCVCTHLETHIYNLHSHDMYMQPIALTELCMMFLSFGFVDAPRYLSFYRSKYPDRHVEREVYRPFCCPSALQLIISLLVSVVTCMDFGTYAFLYIHVCSRCLEFTNALNTSGHIASCLHTDSPNHVFPETLDEYVKGEGFDAVYFWITSPMQGRGRVPLTLSFRVDFFRFFLQA